MKKSKRISSPEQNHIFLFAMRYPVQVHINAVHLKIKPFICGQCSYASVKKSMLDKHFKEVHLKLKPHKCDVCSFSCSIKVNLQDHVNAKHLMVKPFKCNQCSWSSASKKRLSHHIKRVHVGSKPETSEIQCEGVFDSNNVEEDLTKILGYPELSNPEMDNSIHELGYHLELDYLEDTSNAMPSKMKPFKCCACDAAFNLKCFLNIHVRKVHGKDKDVQNQQM